MLLAKAMEESGKVAIARFVMRNKQYTAAIRAENGRLVMSTLAYADEVIDPAEIDELQGLDEIDVSAKEVKMAESLVESLSATFEPEKYRDEYREQVLDLIKIKASGEEFTVPEVVGREAEGRRPDGGARGQRARRQGRARPASGGAGRVDVDSRAGCQADQDRQGAAKSTKAAEGAGQGGAGQEGGAEEEVGLSAARVRTMATPTSRSRSRAAG